MSEFMAPRMTFGDTLRFSPYAWAKLLWMRDRGDTEVAGYCATETEDPLFVTDFILVKQKCTSITFDLDPDDGVEYMERMVDKGLPPWAFSNILAHTHPGNCPSPSGIDEENFRSSFSHPNWAIMFIIAEGGACYCRLKINVGPGSVKELKVAVDWKTSFCGSDTKAWEDEYKTKVSKAVFDMKMTGKEGKNATVVRNFHGFPKDTLQDANDPFWWNDEDNKWGRLSEAEEAELDRLGEKEAKFDTEIDFDCHWDCNGDVAYWDQETSVWFFFDPIISKWYVEAGEENVGTKAIQRPTEEWANSVEDWALRFSDERNIAIEG